MSYLNRLNPEEIDLLLDHPKGFKNQKADIKILNDYKDDKALSNFVEDKVFRESFESVEVFKQVPLF
ncbi:hypothetical protein [Polaribacter aestuariivivens]|jgi:hypothetical protein|uniref:hypothetical protein n=1 Tax=Polaribacter aestuariivivens TaxID=2304626 RepID=UPI003F491D92